ncbi:MAG: cell division protein FtsX [Lutibacter sp.]
MSTSFEKYQKRRLKTSYLSVVISIALVLFLVGVLGVVLIKTKRISEQFKEQVVISVFLKNSAKKADVDLFIAELKKANYTKNVKYISKTIAAKQYSKEIGEDFLKFLGENPLKNAVDITLKSDFVTPNQTQKIEKNLWNRSIVYDINYDKPLIDLLSKNINRLTFWMLFFSAVFTLIAIVLINSSIRLSVYAKRFTIKTMQMVGATKKFIRVPFIWKSIQFGILGAFIAIIGLIALGFYVNTKLPELNLILDYQWYAILALLMLALGIFISWISTYFATQRFLNLQVDELYY